MAQRLPVVGGDGNAWADILDGYLDVAHKADGSLKGVFDLVGTYGADPTFTSDSAPALRSAVTDIISAGGGTLLIPDGHYKLASHDTNGNIVSLPSTGAAHINLLGLTPACAFQQTEGAVLEVTDTAATNGIQALGTALGGMNLTVKNVHFRFPNNPTMAGLDLGWCGSSQLENVLIDIPTLSTQPTHGTNALWTPKVNNNSVNTLRNVAITGFHNGLIATEHLVGDNVQIYAADNAVLAFDNFHALYFNRLLIQNCGVGINMLGSAEGTTMRIGQLDFQDLPPTAWNQLIVHINDASNLLRGSYNFIHVTAGVGVSTAALTNTGGTKFIGTNLYPA